MVCNVFCHLERLTRLRIDGEDDLSGIIRTLACVRIGTRRLYHMVDAAGHSHFAVVRHITQHDSLIFCIAGPGKQNPVSEPLCPARVAVAGLIALLSDHFR